MERVITVNYTQIQFNLTRTLNNVRNIFILIILNYFKHLFSFP